MNDIRDLLPAGSGRSGALCRPPRGSAAASFISSPPVSLLYVKTGAASLFSCCLLYTSMSHKQKHVGPTSSRVSPPLGALPSQPDSPEVQLPPPEPDLPPIQAVPMTDGKMCIRDRSWHNSWKNHSPQWSARPCRAGWQWRHGAAGRSSARRRSHPKAP